MRNKAGPYSTPTLVLKTEKTKLFYIYYILLSIKQLEKKIEILELKPALSRIRERS